MAINKKETTGTIENAGKKIQKGIVKTPQDKDGSQQEMAKMVEEVKQENRELKKLEVKKIEKPKKTEATVRVTGPVSTRHCVALCNFVKKKNIEKSIKELEEVVAKTRALPMKGEFAHRKGKGIMSGKYPQVSTKYFIKLLKSLQSNANANDIKNPVIVQAISNLAQRPRGRFGSYTRKRTHITIIAKDIEKQNKEDKKPQEVKK
jgi:ribosomal protein L22